MFQSTHPRGVRPPAPHRRPRSSRCFNPRTRVGCDERRVFPGHGAQKFQSTHPRGVRLGGGRTTDGRIAVSIHAPAWGATWYTSQTSSLLLSFNPRTRVGCDSCGFAVNSVQLSFNPRTRVGCDGDAARPAGGNVTFQSTHPRGVRLGDQFQGHLSQPVSIHAPAWGATHHRPGRPCGYAGFNPRTRVGCDVRGADKPAPPQLVSIHAPAWGATIMSATVIQ